ncbi:MAG TPA: hypothetical protein VK513_09990, partial [Terriglobales bacterium]|nr:hypothetical protein [Terriglobales bacterium]
DGTPPSGPTWDRAAEFNPAKKYAVIPPSWRECYFSTGLNRNLGCGWLYKSNPETHNVSRSTVPH